MSQLMKKKSLIVFNTNNKDYILSNEILILDEGITTVKTTFDLIQMPNGEIHSKYRFDPCDGHMCNISNISITDEKGNTLPYEPFNHEENYSIDNKLCFLTTDPQFIIYNKNNSIKLNIQFDIEILTQEFFYEIIKYLEKKNNNSSIYKALKKTGLIKENSFNNIKFKQKRPCYNSKKEPLIIVMNSAMKHGASLLIYNFIK